MSQATALSSPSSAAGVASPPGFSVTEFRQALGLFATGVTIVTAKGSDGRLVGLTASSFNSVSLAPPLVLWSLAMKAGSLPVFAAGSHYAIHVLAADQMHLAMQFAGSSTDKFAGVDHSPGLAGAPIIAGAAASFQCFNRSQYTEGDHIIFVGEVEHCAWRPDATPLLYHGGKFYTEHPLQAVAPNPAALASAVTAANPAGQGPGFVSGYLGYLLGQASHAVYAGFEATVAAQGLSHIEWRVLAVLADASAGSPSGMGITQLAQGVLAKQPTVTKLVQRMLEAGLVKLKTDPSDQRRTVVVISPKGLRKAQTLTAAAKLHEVAQLASLSSTEIATFKGLLARLGASA